jgi:hypothetical protein
MHREALIGTCRDRPRPLLEMIETPRGYKSGAGSIKMLVAPSRLLMRIEALGAIITI